MSLMNTGHSIKVPPSNKTSIPRTITKRCHHRNVNVKKPLLIQCSATPQVNSQEEPPVAWDPEGILPPTPAGGHLQRRAIERAAKEASISAPPKDRPPPPGPPIRPLPRNVNAEQGILTSDTKSYDKKALAAELAANYLPVDLDYPGLRLHHLDPPVFTIDGFFTPEECQRMSKAAVETGRMVKSKVGAGNVHDSAAVAAASARRTSTSLLVDDAALAAHPELNPSVSDLQSRGMKLLGADKSGKPWGEQGKLPAPGQYCYEGLQITQYEQGQYFMEHEDGFPIDLARTNRFNRHATLLVYLNDVEKGGATRFDYLNLSVSPAVGRALLFFPCFSDGTPDARSLHTATTAEDWKIVTQQWVARGYSTVAAMEQAMLRRKAEEESVKALEGLVAGGKKKKKILKGKKQQVGGFGGGGFAKS